MFFRLSVSVSLCLCLSLSLSLSLSSQSPLTDTFKTHRIKSPLRKKKTHAASAFYLHYLIFPYFATPSVLWRRANPGLLQIRRLRLNLEAYLTDIPFSFATQTKRPERRRHHRRSRSNYLHFIDPASTRRQQRLGFLKDEAFLYNFLFQTTQVDSFHLWEGCDCGQV